MTWSPREGELIAERFLLERELARGGMGSVWTAHHVTLDSPCAVKFIDERFASSELLRRRFEAEARTAAKLRSRHVVQTLDYGVWNGSPYIAMELLEGETLADRLGREGRLSPLDTLHALKGVVRALSKARVLSIVHRDLKPENIFLVREGDNEYAKVLDFGIAKLRDANEIRKDGKTKTGAILGTPFYMSPEQADGTVELDYRSDLWSLAVIAFECLTAEVPFYSEAFGNLVTKIISGPLPLPSDYHDLGEPVDEWWLRAAQRDREKRFQTAGELFEALEEALFRDALTGDMPADRPSRASWITPPSMRARLSSRDSAAPSESDPGMLGLPNRLGGWSTPHSSARPPDSDTPPDEPVVPSVPVAVSQPPSEEPSSEEPSSEDARRRTPQNTVPIAGADVARHTFEGHASSRPGVAPSRRRWLVALALVSGVAAAVVAGVVIHGRDRPTETQAAAEPNVSSPTPDEPATGAATASASVPVVSVSVSASAASATPPFRSPLRSPGKSPAPAASQAEPASPYADPDPGY